MALVIDRLGHHLVSSILCDPSLPPGQKGGLLVPECQPTSVIGLAATATLNSQGLPRLVHRPFKGNEMLREQGYFCREPHRSPPFVKEVEGGEGGVPGVTADAEQSEDVLAAPWLLCGSRESLGHLGAPANPHSSFPEKGRLRNLFLWGGLCWEGGNRC